jgi:hypothetical protein
MVRIRKYGTSDLTTSLRETFKKTDLEGSVAVLVQCAWEAVRSKHNYLHLLVA